MPDPDVKPEADRRSLARLRPSAPRWLSRSGPPVQIGAWRVALIGVAIVLAWQLSSVLLLLFFAVLIATILRGAAEALADALRAPPWLMLTLVVIVFIIGGCVAAYWIGPALAGQADDMVGRLTGQLQHFRNAYGDTSIGRALSRRLSGPNGLETYMTGHAVDIASFTVGTIGELFAVLVISIYLAAAPATYVNGVVSLVPSTYRPLTLRVMNEIGQDLRRWLLGQLADMLVVGGLSAIGLDLLGVPVPFALATLAGLLTIVPYFGTVVAGLAAVMVAVTQGWIVVTWTIAIFVICHVIEGYLLAPLLQHRLVRLPPALIIVTMTIAATLFGWLGIVLGTPLAVTAMVIVRRVYIEHILGDRTAMEAS